MTKDRTAYAKAYHRKNRAKRLAQMKVYGATYRANHREQARAATKAWHQAKRLQKAIS